jgi:uncharacterized protein (TIGR00251 family)
MPSPIDSSSCCRIADGSVLLELKVHAGARRNQIGPLAAGRLKVSVTAAPEKGKANKAVAKLIAAWTGVSLSSVAVSSGLTNPLKTLSIATSQPIELLKTIRKLLANPDAGRL